MISRRNAANRVAAIMVGVALVVPASAWADFPGRVVAVVDGDSITVLRGRDQVKVRLVGIDAPEKAQPFGNRSKQAPSAQQALALVYGKDVFVVERGHDKYQRTLGRVYRSGLDVNAERVRQGTAWVFRQYSHDAALYRIEADQSGASCPVARSWAGAAMGMAKGSTMTSVWYEDPALREAHHVVSKAST